MRRDRFACMLGAIIVVALLATLTPTLGHAITGVGTEITNTVNVSWTGGSTTAAATLTVALKPTAPVLDTPPNQGPIGEGASITVSYRVTSQANGMDTYTLSSVFADNTAKISTPTATVNSGTTEIVLGASMVVNVTESGGNTIITLAQTPTLAGLTSGFITKNSTGTAHTITASDDTAKTITLAGTGLGFSIGDNVNQQLSFNVTFTTGTLVGSVTTATHALTAKAEVKSDSSLYDDNLVEVTVNESALAVIKTADNTAPMPGNTVTYTILILATGSDAVNVIATDEVPAYTTLKVATGNFAQIFACDKDTYTAGSPPTITVTNCSATPEDVSTATDTDSTVIGSGDASGITEGSDIHFYLGNGNDGTAAKGGTIATDKAIKIVYQVTIN